MFTLDFNLDSINRVPDSIFTTIIALSFVYLFVKKRYKNIIVLITVCVGSVAHIAVEAYLKATADAFFEKYEGLEFVDEDEAVISEISLSRVKYTHKFYGKAGSVKDLLGAIATKGQKLLGVDRTKKYENVVFQKGRNWFSITHGLAKLVVEKEAWIQEVFGQSVCGDELFLQTVARNSEYAEKICNPNTMPEIPDTRYIDWERGSNNNPYVFREEDFEELKNAPGLFARKFDFNVDKKIVEKL